MLTENFRSESFSIHTSKGRAPASELTLLRGGLSSRISHYKGEALMLESKIVYRRVVADFEKPKIYFHQQGPKISLKLRWVTKTVS